MNWTLRSSLFTSALSLCFALSSIFTVANAASISYGNFPFPPSGMALNVTESSGTDPVPLYGPPQPVVNGLDFDPMNFVATSGGGGADLTDGQLNFTVMSPGLNSLSLFEAGDYLLFGAGGAGTQVIAAASIRATVTQINGVNVAPIPLVPNSNSFGDNLAGGPEVLSPWSVAVALDIAGQLPANARATKVDIVIDNLLFASSQQNSAAFIAKKEFILQGEFIPEPTTAALGAVALCGLGLAGRKRR